MTHHVRPESETNSERVMSSGKRVRHGFTLVEMLVVIAIIVVLLGLLLSAVFVALGTRARSETTENIRQLAKGVSEFKTHFGVYPPSRIYLSRNIADYSSSGNEQLKADSLKYLYDIWPRLNMNDPSWKDNPYLEPQVLEGDQCLVFFLGGIPRTDSNGIIMLGFAKGDNVTPLSENANVPRIKFFEFESDRLIKRGGSHYYSYADPFETGQPFAYFSHGFRNNGYSDNDCSTLGIIPFYKSTSPVKQYLRPDGFQIMSAGEDGQFGGTTLGAFNPRTGMQLPKAVRDNYANFHNLKLGSGN